MPCSFASVSVRPTQAISGSVYATEGMRARRNSSSRRRNFRGNLGFVRRLVRQHRAAGKIADRENMRHVGTHLLVDGDDAALVDVHAGFFGIELVAVRAPPDRDEHAIVNTADGALVAFESDFDARRPLRACR